ncbi:hypothetical protein [Niveispirillum sp. BGYR6]|uniref:hypothetical protein n=1 Tax=Niveispirillum sp. BGYR6 TaxID=2971249 RepID=UPI0022B9523D|nr:hypothetical protein [Niveispirillum sp. BGYR6]MDG5497816.1 hypothetical protein [Niveispirillum sp. BGYR6]
MAERCFLLPSLTATEALQVLAALVEAGFADTGREARLRLQFEGGGYLRILVPDPSVQIGSPDKRKRREEMFDRMRQRLTAIMGPYDDEVAHLDPDADIFKDPFLFTPTLLLDSAMHRRGEPASPLDGEVLLLLPAGDEAEAWRQFDQLNTHATAVRIAAARTAEGADEGFFLFHLRDDEARVSSFQGLLGSGFLSAAIVLEGYEADGCGIFLPPGTAPDPQALAAFQKIRPALLPQMEVARGEPALAITVTVQDGRREVDLYPLNRLRYRDKTALWPAASPASASTELVRIHSLVNSDAMVEKLAERVRAVEPLVGYELELRADYPGAGAEMDLLRVQEKIAYYTELSAYLAGLTRPQPVLMRFADRDLPALADALRRFTLQDIDDGRIRYGFQATGADDGVHYLLIQPEETAPSSFLPEYFWREQRQAGPMLFRVDPFFARFYDAARPGSLVFVPEQQTLFPPLHSWDQADIDSYLRQTLSSWFHGDRGAQAIPPEPYYLFRPNPAGAIVVEVLDGAAFVPLRQRIGWLNRNLELRHRLELESLIDDLATKAGRATLAERVAAEETAAIGLFTDAAARAQAHLGGQLGDLLDQLAQEAGQTAARTAAALDSFDKLYRDIDDIERATAELTQRARTLEQVKAELHSESDSFKQVRQQLEEQVYEAIKASDATLAKLEDSVTERVARLKETHRRLQDRLLEMREGR